MFKYIFNLLLILMYFAHDKSITNLGKNHICLYVGSFDPPHIGHQNMVTHLNNLCLFDYIMLIPTFNHCFKDNVSDFNYRFDMIKIAFCNLKNIIISNIEKEIYDEKKGNNLTCDTIKFLRKHHPNAKFSLSMGSDLFNTFSKWVNLDSYSNVDVYVVSRAGYPIDPEVLDTIRRVYWINVILVNELYPIQNMSSTIIKKKLVSTCLIPGI